MKTRAKAPDELRVELSARQDLAARFTRDVLAPRNPDLADLLRRREPGARQRAFFVVDSGVARARPDLPAAIEAYARAHSDALVLAGAPLVVEGGQAAKTRPEVCDWLRARLTGAAIDARSHLVIVGGGALLDAAGFAGATLHGGVRVTRVPTTLAAQAAGAWASDCALDACGRRDWMRAPQTPFGVLVDSRFLSSLPAAERRAGLAEAVRLALAADARLFHWICDRVPQLAAFDRKTIETLARWCARLNWEGLGGLDAPRAPESRAGGFGRWAAYALLARADDLPPGDACAIGAAVDTLLSVVMWGLPAEAARAALDALSGLGLTLWHDVLGESDDSDCPALLSGLAELRERQGGAPSVPLLRGLGRVEDCASVNGEALAAVIEALHRWCGLE